MAGDGHLSELAEETGPAETPSGVAPHVSPSMLYHDSRFDPPIVIGSPFLLDDERREMDKERFDIGMYEICSIDRDSIGSCWNKSSYIPLIVLRSKKSLVKNWEPAKLICSP